MSLTKEEILSKELRKSRLSEDSFPNIMEAMDKYAFQEMGKFAEWCCLHYQLDKVGIWVDNEDTQYTTEDLIQLYLKRQLP